MLNDLRRDLGTEAFFDLLRRYYEAGSGKIMEPSDFWAMLSDDELAATQATRRRYFRSP
jgi:aminopeptidase N